MKSPPIEVRAKLHQPLGMSSARFLRDYWQKRPLLIRNAFANFISPLTPDDLAGLACEELALSRIVLRFTSHSSFRGRSQLQRERNPESAYTPSRRADSGSPRRGVRNDEKWELRTGPFAESEFATLPKSHWTLLVQDVDKWDADVAALLDRFDFLPCWRIDDVMVSYATDGGGVGAHLDQYDVFLLQGIGQRRWRIDSRANPPDAFRDDAELKLLREFSPSHAWTLDPGDMLYLPPGVPHEGIAIGECMTFSIGMRAPSSAELFTDFAGFMAERLPEAMRYADPDLRPIRENGEIDDAALARVMRAMPWLDVDENQKQQRAGNIADPTCELNASLLRMWLGCFLTGYRSAHTAAPPPRKIKPETLQAELERSVFLRNPWSRFAWSHAGRGATLFVAGEACPCPLAWVRALASSRRRIDGAALAKLPSRPAGIDLLATLINAGHFVMQKA